MIGKNQDKLGYWRVFTNMLLIFFIGSAVVVGLVFINAKKREADQARIEDSAVSANRPDSAKQIVDNFVPDSVALRNRPSVVIFCNGPNRQAVSLSINVDDKWILRAGNGEIIKQGEVDKGNGKKMRDDLLFQMANWRPQVLGRGMLTIDVYVHDGKKLKNYTLPRNAYVDDSRNERWRDAMSELHRILSKYADAPVNYLFESIPK